MKPHNAKLPCKRHAVLRYILGRNTFGIMPIYRLWPPAQPPNSAAGGHSWASGLYSGFAQTTLQRRLTMSDTNIAKSEPVLVAIDISKARHEVLIVIPGKNRRWRLTVLNQMDDFNRLIATLSDYGCPVRVDMVA
jgi:hypothetical protein